VSVMIVLTSCFLSRRARRKRTIVIHGNDGIPFVPPPIAYRMPPPPYLRLRPPRNIAAEQYGLLLAEERWRARDGCICGGGDGLGQRCGEAPDPTLPADKRAESAEARGKERWGQGVDGEREEVRVGGELCGPVGRSDRCARMEDGARA
jgi:hypothetical protein